MNELVKAVREYAIEHYADGDGWDYVVEAYTDAEIAHEIRNARTAAGAIRKIGKIVGLFAERDAVRWEEW